MLEEKFCARFGKGQDKKKYGLSDWLRKRGHAADLSDLGLENANKSVFLASCADCYKTQEAQLPTTTRIQQALAPSAARSQEGSKNAPSVHERVSVQKLLVDVMARHSSGKLQRRKLVVQQLWIHLTLKKTPSDPHVGFGTKWKHLF